MYIFDFLSVVEEETNKGKKTKKEEGKEAEDEAMKIPMHKRKMNTFIPSPSTYPRAIMNCFKQRMTLRRDIMSFPVICRVFQTGIRLLCMLS